MNKISFIILISILSLNVYSQSTILRDDISDGQRIIEAYFNPLAESLGAGLNNGWYNTAKPHNFAGFDFTISLSTVIIPNEVKTFSIGNNFGNFTSNNTDAATIFGENSTTSMLYNETSTNHQWDFNLPGGFNIPAMPTPMLQAGIGLIKKTSVDVRYMPTLNLSDIETNLFGIGVKHDILQWIPVIGDAIPMSLSLQAGYTELNTSLDIYEQKVSMKTTATTINLIASRKLLILTGYVGLGYNTSVTNLSADAGFNLSGVDFSDKIEIEFQSENKLRTNVGLRLNLTVVTIHADYTFSEYPTATLGLGVSLR